MSDSLNFIVWYSTVLLIFIQLMAFWGQDLAQESQYTGVIQHFPNENLIDAENPTSLTGSVTAFFNNIWFFFDLMRVDSSFWWIGSFVLTPFVIGVTWALIEIIKDVIPFT